MGFPSVFIFNASLTIEVISLVSLLVLSTLGNGSCPQCEPRLAAGLTAISSCHVRCQHAALMKVYSHLSEGPLPALRGECNFRPIPAVRPRRRRRGATPRSGRSYEFESVDGCGLEAEDCRNALVAILGMAGNNAIWASIGVID